MGKIIHPGPANSDWLDKMADLEDQYPCISSGRLWALEANENANTEPNHTLAFSRLVEFARRNLKLTVEEFSTKTDIDVELILAIERDGSEVSPRAVFQIAKFLGLSDAILMVIAGLVESRNHIIPEAALKFAARSEPAVRLSDEERAAFDEFVATISTIDEEGD